MKNIELEVLRAKLCGLQLAGVKLNKLIMSSKGDVRARLRNEKRLLGQFTRYHKVAYGLICGTPYEKIEKCGKHNRLSPARLRKILTDHNLSELWSIDQIQAILQPTE